MNGVWQLSLVEATLFRNIPNEGRKIFHQRPHLVTHHKTALDDAFVLNTRGTFDHSGRRAERHAALDKNNIFRVRRKSKAMGTERQNFFEDFQSARPVAPADHMEAPKETFVRQPVFQSDRQGRNQFSSFPLATQNQVPTFGEQPENSLDNGLNRIVSSVFSNNNNQIFNPQPFNQNRNQNNQLFNQNRNNLQSSFQQNIPVTSQNRGPQQTNQRQNNQNSIFRNQNQNSISNNFVPSSNSGFRNPSSRNNQNNPISNQNQNSVSNTIVTNQNSQQSGNGRTPNFNLPQQNSVITNGPSSTTRIIQNPNSPSPIIVTTLPPRTQGRTQSSVGISRSTFVTPQPPRRVPSTIRTPRNRDISVINPSQFISGRSSPNTGQGRQGRINTQEARQGRDGHLYSAPPDAGYGAPDDHDDQPAYEGGEQIEILKMTGLDEGPLPNFNFMYQTANDISVMAEGELKNICDEDVSVMRGSYEYVGPDGNTYKVEWYADETGFHPTLDHLPQPVAPDHPEVAAAVAAQLAAAGPAPAPGPMPCPPKDTYDSPLPSLPSYSSLRI